MGKTLLFAAAGAALLGGAIVADNGPATAQPADLAPLMEIGRPVYEDNCASCHASNGRGDIGPSLAGNARLRDGATVRRQIAQGGSEMPPFAGLITDEEIDAVATYVMNAWGNEFGPVP